MLQTKRAYEPAARSDGYRVLVDRLWPRGLSKQAARIDRWARELAPSDRVRAWFGHRPERFPEFRRRYRAELEGRTGELEELARLARSGVVTLVFAARDGRHSNATVLRELVEERGARGGSPPERNRIGAVRNLAPVEDPDPSPRPARRHVRRQD